MMWLRRSIWIKMLPALQYSSHPAQSNSTWSPNCKPGCGQYGKTVGKVTRNIIETNYNTLLNYFDTVPVPEKGVFTIADYGTNDGFSSLPLMESLIRRLRVVHGKQLPIQIIYEDQETNDFNSLFNVLNAERDHTLWENVYPLATNTNFYKQCVPAETCDVIISIFSCNWLRETGPVREEDGHETSVEEAERFTQRSAKDFQDFLWLRAKELKSGGILAVWTGSGVDEDSLKLKNSFAPMRNKGDKLEDFITAGDNFKHLEASWRELKDMGVIKEHRKFRINLIFRTPEEPGRSFLDKTSPVSQAGLSLLAQELAVYPPISEGALRERPQNEGKVDNNNFATQYVSNLRVSTYQAFLNSLSDMRSAEEKGAILDRLYEVFHQKLLRCDRRTFKAGPTLMKFFAQKRRI